jgi:hypothetical protein
VKLGGACFCFWACHWLSAACALIHCAEDAWVGLQPAKSEDKRRLEGTEGDLVLLRWRLTELCEDGKLPLALQPRCPHSGSTCGLRW